MSICSVSTSMRGALALVGHGILGVLQQVVDDLAQLGGVAHDLAISGARRVDHVAAVAAR
jgi:hypothetical protein